jgi:transposase
VIGLASGALKVFLALEPQDIRKSFQGLSELAVEHLGEELRREALFVFTNKRRGRASKKLPPCPRGAWPP